MQHIDHVIKWLDGAYCGRARSRAIMVAFIANTLPAQSRIARELRFRLWVLCLVAPAIIANPLRIVMLANSASRPNTAVRVPANTPPTRTLICGSDNARKLHCGRVLATKIRTCAA